MFIEHKTFKKSVHIIKGEKTSNNCLKTNLPMGQGLNVSQSDYSVEIIGFFIIKGEKMFDLDQVLSDSRTVIEQKITKNRYVKNSDIKIKTLMC